MLLENESACCFRSLVYHMSRDRRIRQRRESLFVLTVDKGGWLCCSVQDRVLLKSIYRRYNIQIKIGISMDDG